MKKYNSSPYESEISCGHKLIINQKQHNYERSNL